MSLGFDDIAAICAIYDPLCDTIRLLGPTARSQYHRTEAYGQPNLTAEPSPKPISEHPQSHGDQRAIVLGLLQLYRKTLLPCLATFAWVSSLCQQSC